MNFNYSEEGEFHNFQKFAKPGKIKFKETFEKVNNFRENFSNENVSVWSCVQEDSKPIITRFSKKYGFHFHFENFSY